MLEKMLFDEFANTTKEWDEISDAARGSWTAAANRIRMHVCQELGVSDLALKVWTAMGNVEEEPMIGISDTEHGIVNIETYPEFREWIAQAGKYECLTIITKNREWIEIVPGNDPDDQIVAYTALFSEGFVS